MARDTALRRTRAGILGILALGAVAWPLLLDGPGPAEIARVVEQAGILAPPLFVVLYAALTVLLVPGAVLTVAAGAIFGPVLGTLLAVLGATAGATAAFLLSRRFGPGVETLARGSRPAQLNAWISRRGFVAMLYARLIPVIPFTGLNYAAGLTSVRLRDYVAATALGILPGAVGYAAVGSSLGDPRSVGFIAAVAFIAALTGAGVFAARRAREHTVRT